MVTDFIAEMKWRGILHDVTPGVEEHIASGMRTAYIGFDPTAPSLTIGNYVQVMTLRRWQMAGHQPIFLMGGATGRIGDPSGKDKERQLKSYDEIEANLAHQKNQAMKFLDFEGGDNRALLLNNYDFYKDMNVLAFLRDVGKNLTVNYMLGKDAVKNRLETGLSFTEFSYQLLQAYDFLQLYKNYNCTIQMGGSDQWGNITSGTEFIRRNIPNGKAYAITSPLLTKSDGKKFGKSEDGNIWLDPSLTSPYKFYQFWVNADDADLPNFYRIFSFKTKEEILALEAQYHDDPQTLKRILGEELTRRIHSENDYDRVLEVSELLFNNKATSEFITSLSNESLKAITNEIPSFEIDRSFITNGTDISNLLINLSGIMSSNGDVRRAIKNNALAVNKLKVSDHKLIIDSSHLLHNQYIMIENGKKNKFMIKLTE